MSCIGMKDLGRVFGCIEGCLFVFFFVTNIGWTFCVQEMYFSFLESFSEFFVTFAIWGMWLYKRNVRLFEVSILSACRPVSESMKIIKKEKKKNYIDTFLHLNILHWHAWILSCLELSFRWHLKKKKKQSHTFVLLCSYKCLD